MNAGNLLSYSIPVLKTSTKGADALELMSDHYVQHLPIVNSEQLLGLISEEDVLEHDSEESIGSYQLSLQQAQVHESTHIFDVMSQLAHAKLSLIPVVGDQEEFLGVISLQDLINYFASSFSFGEAGGIIVLEMSKPDYALSEISRVVEAEGVAILSTFISATLEDNRIYVHIKINKLEIQRVTAALERYGYDVHAMYSDDQDSDVYKDRFESFMHYLNF
ncbi:MAG: CBS domain-containing protein [Saprospiraceae bacterium]|nr:CBS domain-containing protein [Saprospiraceae bacterium]